MHCLTWLVRLLNGLRTNVVLDAAALACVGKRPRMLERATAKCVLTPHAGEMAALLSITRDRIERDPPTYALRAAKRFASVVALKGAQTFIATPSGELFCNKAGTVGLATSGSGDTLAGIIGGLLARGLSPLDATLWGVYAHAKAGAANEKHGARISCSRDTARDSRDTAADHFGRRTIESLPWGIARAAVTLAVLTHLLGT